MQIVDYTKGLLQPIPAALHIFESKVFQIDIFVAVYL